MRYSKNVSLSAEKSSFVSPFVKYASSFAAAAAVFALVFIPVHYNSLSNAKETAVAAISIMKQKSIEPIAKKDVIVSGNLKKEDLSKGLAVNESSALAKKDSTVSSAENSITASDSSLPVEQKTIYATNLASSYGARTSFGSSSAMTREFREKLTSVDPFIPDFSSSSITISVPNFNEIGNNMEIMEIQK